MSTLKETGNRPVPLLDVPRSNLPLRGEFQEAIMQVCDSGQFLFGPDCRKLEESVAAWCGADHAIGCASGSDSLLIALMAEEIGPGDEVIVPSFTFFATASAVSRLGARPVFVDIDPVSFNISPAAIRDAITPATRAIIPVHLFGQCAEMPEIMAIARQHELLVIEDAAQAIGASVAGEPAGSWGDVGCLSFYPTKNLGGFGDGGMMVTQDHLCAERLRLYATHGMKPRYEHHVVGINSRLDSIQAAALNVKIKHLPEAIRLRQQNADRYQELFEQAGIDHQVVLPASGETMEHVWNQFTIRVPGQRDPLAKHLGEKQIGHAIYYPIPLHQQACFQVEGESPLSLPETEKACKEVLSLPIFPELIDDELQQVVGSIGDFFAQQQRSAA
ncbi:MAG: DegT/DnrJ/EryC1/StrS family aminotransferase [Pirellulaceae bacterium]